MKKILFLALFFLLTTVSVGMSASITGVAGGTSLAVGTGGLFITASNGVTMTLVSTVTTYTSTSTHANGTKLYSTTQDAGITEAAKTN